MIPAEAVEAAAKGIASANLRSKPWADLGDEARNHFSRDARAALEAAAPQMLAGAWDEGSNSGYRWALIEGPWQEPGETAPKNPYRMETP